MRTIYDLTTDELVEFMVSIGACRRSRGIVLLYRYTAQDALLGLDTADLAWFIDELGDTDTKARFNAEIHALDEETHEAFYSISDRRFASERQIYEEFCQPDEFEMRNRAIWDSTLRFDEERITARDLANQQERQITERYAAEVAGKLEF